EYDRWYSLDGCGPTAWRSVAASAPEPAFKIATISRAKRSTATPCSAAAGVQPFQLVYSVWLPFLAYEVDNEKNEENKYNYIRDGCIRTPSACKEIHENNKN